MTSETKVVSELYRILKVLYGVVPIVAGLDKFTNLLTDWSRYVAPPVARLLPFSPETFMGIVGVIEIAAGVLVLSKFTRWAALIVSAWLVGIALNLLLGGFYDIAVRDLSMAVGAYGLSRLAEVRAPSSARARSHTLTPEARTPARV